ncbi:hypothetical protein ABN16_06815 [Levilactobacillus koreensis]|uniref:Uncharacterized protein n=1 Tax=Levilactobacillus koreensis TaxID=637971 RepID=A0AAC8UX42_9LACO|nr:hypothetical protein ABN16_06815 [Levilactobacillus koreensis]
MKLGWLRMAALRLPGTTPAVGTLQAQIVYYGNGNFASVQIKRVVFTGVLSRTAEGQWTYGLFQDILQVFCP